MEDKDRDRIDGFIEAIMNVAQGDYSVQLELSDENDYLDALAIGINMMVDDLRHGRSVELENEKIKELNVQLQRAKEKAEESERLKSVFLANMSHEIRTPMNGIMGFLELLKEPRLSEEAMQEYINIIDQSGKRLLNIINDVISLSKIEAGETKVTLDESNINDQIDFIYTFFVPESEQKGIKLVFHKGLPDDRAKVKTDREKIYAVLTNLIKNALKFTPKGTIEFGYMVENDNSTESNEKSSTPRTIKFFVRDTGIGIPPEYQDVIFDRFRQVDETVARNYEGAGLGLSISKAYVNMLGGKIWVKSEKGVGSTFYFTIPYFGQQPKSNQNIIPFVPEIKKYRKFTLLIAEDDKNSLILISHFVKDFCDKIIIVNTGYEAVNTCRNNPKIDLILMDIQMPDMDGYEATREIRKFNSQITIIAQTAFGLDGDMEKALQAGCNDYISKPIQRSVLLDILKKYRNEV